MNLPKKASEPFITRENLPGAERWRGSVSACIDPYTGGRIDNTRRQPTGIQMMEMVWPLHAGWWGGVPTKVVYALIGFFPLVLTITGVGKWALRKRAVRQNQRLSRLRLLSTQSKQTLA